MICTFPGTYSQGWSEPVEISTLQGNNSYPDFCIDNNGTLHCVWSYKYEQNHRVIFYSKSTDEGLTWSEPEDVSQNTELWMDNPHIVSDSQNNLHLTFDFNAMGTNGGTLVVYKTYDGQSWSNHDTLSVGWPWSHKNQLVIDNNDNLICFWMNQSDDNTYYRIKDNSGWSSIELVYNDNNTFQLANAISDSQNTIHCSGYYYYEGQSSPFAHMVYSTYTDEIWSDIEQVSQGDQVWVGNDIALDIYNNPHIIWREHLTQKSRNENGTMYSYTNGIFWSNPILIANMASNMAITIDRFNNKFIIHNEEHDNYNRLISYQYMNEEWIGEIADEDSIGFYCNQLISSNNFIYLINVKVHSNPPDYHASIQLRRYEVIENIEDRTDIETHAFNIYPNPTPNSTTISFSLANPTDISIKIHDLQGRLIKTLGKEIQNSGSHQIIWNGTDENGKEVKGGLYFVRLQTDKYVMTRAVEIIK